MDKLANLFFVTFCCSTIIHIPLYSLIGNFYFFKKPHARHDQETVQKPFFTYIPYERPVVITKASLSSSTSSEHKVESQPLPVVSSKKRSSLISRLLNEVRADRESRRLKRHIARVVKERQPVVENIDMTNGIVREAFLSYYELLSAIIGRFAVYPVQARMEGIEGVAYISFILRESGDLGEVVLQESSGNSLLDRAAMSAIQNAAPFPPLPFEINKNEIRLNVPISFEFN